MACSDAEQRAEGALPKAHQRTGGAGREDTTKSGSRAHRETATAEAPRRGGRAGSPAAFGRLATSRAGKHTACTAPLPRRNGLCCLSTWLSPERCGHGRSVIATASVLLSASTSAGLCAVTCYTESHAPCARIPCANVSEVPACRSASSTRRTWSTTTACTTASACSRFRRRPARAHGRPASSAQQTRYERRLRCRHPTSSPCTANVAQAPSARAPSRSGCCCGRRKTKGDCFFPHGSPPL